MARQYSIAEARDRLPGIVHEVEMGEPVELTRRGKPVAVVMSLPEFQRLRSRRPNFGEAVAAFRASVDWSHGGWTDEDSIGLRDPGPGREVDA